MNNYEKEKSQSIVRNLSEIIHILKNNPIFDLIANQLNSTLIDATILWAKFQEAEWHPTDHTRIMEHGLEGYEELSFFYGVIEEIAISKKIREFRKALTEIRDLIKGPRAPNRTLIHNELSPLDHQDPFVDKIDSLTMLVTMGEKEWEDYVKEVKSHLDEWDNVLKERELEIANRMRRERIIYNNYVKY